jgi:hypothetical protein
MSAIAIAVLLLSQVEKGEEVEVTSGAVTALSCAVRAMKSGNLDLLNACPMIEAQKEIVVFDVAEKQIYRISKKAVHRFELESAFGGGSIDFTGVVIAVDESGTATVDVSEYSVMARPRAGAFKGCL